MRARPQEASETVKLVGGGVAAAADFVRSTATAETPLVLLVCLPAGDEVCHAAIPRPLQPAASAAPPLPALGSAGWTLRRAGATSAVLVRASAAV